MLRVASAALAPNGNTKMSWEFPHQLRRVQFRRLSMQDTPEFLAYRSDPSVARFQGWSPMSESEARQFLGKASEFTELAPGTWSQLAIAEIQSNKLLGDAGLWLAPDSTQAEFGISLATHAQGKGLGGEAIGGLIKWLLSATSISGVVAHTDVRNEACIRALKRAGMTQTGARTQTYKGEVCTEYCFLQARLGS